MVLSNRETVNQGVKALAQVSVSSKMIQSRRVQEQFELGTFMQQNQLYSRRQNGTQRGTHNAEDQRQYGTHNAEDQKIIRNSQCRRPAIFEASFKQFQQNLQELTRRIENNIPNARLVSDKSLNAGHNNNAKKRYIIEQMKEEQLRDLEKVVALVDVSEDIEWKYRMKIAFGEVRQLPSESSGENIYIKTRDEEQIIENAKKFLEAIIQKITNFCFQGVSDWFQEVVFMQLVRIAFITLRITEIKVDHFKSPEISQGNDDAKRLDLIRANVVRNLINSESAEETMEAMKFTHNNYYSQSIGGSVGLGIPSTCTVKCRPSEMAQNTRYNIGQGRTDKFRYEQGTFATLDARGANELLQIRLRLVGIGYRTAGVNYLYDPDKTKYWRPMDFSTEFIFGLNDRSEQKSMEEVPQWFAEQKRVLKCIEEGKLSDMSGLEFELSDKPTKFRPVGLLNHRMRRRKSKDLSNASTTYDKHRELSNSNDIESQQQPDDADDDAPPELDDDDADVEDGFDNEEQVIQEDGKVKEVAGTCASGTLTHTSPSNCCTVM